MWYLLAPILVGTACAVLFWILGRTKLPRLDGRSAVLTALAAGASSLVMIVFWGGPVIPIYVTELSAFPWGLYTEIRYVLPLALGILTVLALGIPARRRPSLGAQLTPRTWWSFLGRQWLAIILSVLGIVVAVSVAAGLASQRDDEGHYTLYIVELGSGSAATTFYGWHFSVVPLIALGVLLAATVVAWAAIARPPHSEDHESDVARRRLRSTNVARIATGAMLLHLSTVLRSLAETSAMSLSVGTEAGETFQSGTSFAALSTVLNGSGPLVGSLGLALWVVTALSSSPRTLAPTRATATA